MTLTIKQRKMQRFELYNNLCSKRWTAAIIQCYIHTNKLHSNSAAIEIQQSPQRRWRLNATEEYSDLHIIHSVPYFSWANIDEEKQHDASLGYCLRDSLCPITLFIGEIRKGVSRNTYRHHQRFWLRNKKSVSLFCFFGSVGWPENIPSLKNLRWSIV